MAMFTLYEQIVRHGMDAEHEGDTVQAELAQLALAGYGKATSVMFCGQCRGLLAWNSIPTDGKLGCKACRPLAFYLGWLDSVPMLIEVKKNQKTCQQTLRVGTRTVQSSPIAESKRLGHTVWTAKDGRKTVWTATVPLPPKGKGAKMPPEHRKALQVVEERTIEFLRA